MRGARGGVSSDAMRIARIARVGATNRVVRARAGRSLFDRLLDAVTPKDVPSDARADETYETWRAMCSKETLACVEALRGTTLAGRALEVTFDAAASGYAARAFHEACDGAGPCFVVGKTRRGARFGGFNPVGFYSVEDYRETSDAFLCAWEDDAAYRRGEPPSRVSNVLAGGKAAIFDFGAQGPCFGVDALRVPLGCAPPNGSSYAGVGGTFDLGVENAAGSRVVKSRLGTYYEGFDDGEGLFTKKEGAEAELVELLVLSAPSLRRSADDGLYVS